MRRWIAVAVIACALTMSSGMARAEGDVSEQYHDSVMHPLRFAAYLFHPVGYAAEWLIGRPFHYIISRPYLDRIFGYQPITEEGSYRRFSDRL